MAEKLAAVVVGLCLVAGVFSVEVINTFEDENEFSVYWNVPSFQCHPHKIYFNELAHKYSIIQNADDSFKGEKITILYDPGNFPAILKRGSENEQFLRNGGVPQEGNLTDHLINFEERVLNDIPDPKYNGVAVIDFESWRPIFRQNWGTLLPYKNLSIEIERRKHPTWSQEKLTAEAIRRFESYGRIFVEQTLFLAQSMRPNATWGYYAYPYCFNMAANSMQPQCAKEVQEENNQMIWLFKNSDSLLPSLYLPQNRLDEQGRVQLIEGRILESQRLNARLGQSKQILPYFWYIYQDSGEFLSKDDLRNALIILKSFNINGVIIWGSSNDVNSRKKCEALYNYVDKVLGPILVST